MASSEELGLGKGQELTMAELLNFVDFGDLSRSIESDPQLVEHIAAQQHVSSGRKSHLHLCKSSIADRQINQIGGPGGDLAVVATHNHRADRYQLPLVYQGAGDDRHARARIEFGSLRDEAYSLEGWPGLKVQVRRWRLLGCLVGKRLHGSRGVDAGDINETMRPIGKDLLEVNDFLRELSPDALDQGALISIGVDHLTTLYRDPATRVSVAQPGPQGFISRNLTLEPLVHLRLSLARKCHRIFRHS